MLIAAPKAVACKNTRLVVPISANGFSLFSQPAFDAAVRSFLREVVSIARRYGVSETKAPRLARERRARSQGKLRALPSRSSPFSIWVEWLEQRPKARCIYILRYFSSRLDIHQRDSEY
jgi:hypothetical protein